MLYPLIFQPIFQERIWGGRNLERLYKKRLPRDLKIGESWEVSDRAEAQSVVQNGPFAGKTLHWLMENYERDLLGKAKSLKGRFPLLVKILDAEEKLSLQVHPPAGSAAVLGGEAKTEMWYITEARPGAQLPQLPPQSTSVSVPSRTLSWHEMQTLAAHTPLAQSDPWRQPMPSAQRPQPAPVPPQSTPVSLPFWRLSSQEKLTHTPPLQIPLWQSRF